MKFACVWPSWFALSQKINRAISEVNDCFKVGNQDEAGVPVDTSKTTTALNNLMTSLKGLSVLLDDDAPVERAIGALTVGFGAMQSQITTQGAELRELREMVQKLNLHVFNSKKAEHGESEFLRFRAPVVALEGRILVTLEKRDVGIDWKSVRSGGGSKQDDRGDEESLYLLREWYNSPDSDAAAKQKTAEAFVYLFGEYGRNVSQVLDNMLAVTQPTKERAMPLAYPTNVTTDEIRDFIDILVANSQMGKTEIEKFLKYCDLAAQKPEFIKDGVSQDPRQRAR